MDYKKARKLLEQLVWRSTHKDFRSVREDGSKVINHYDEVHGTMSVRLDSLPMQQLFLKLTTRERDALPLEIREMVFPPRDAI